MISEILVTKKISLTSYLFILIENGRKKQRLTVIILHGVIIVVFILMESMRSES
jgi:hypothetical protein